VNVIKAQAGKRERRNYRNMIRFMRKRLTGDARVAEIPAVELHVRDLAHRERARIWR
jgi:hypothetical protein